MSLIRVGDEVRHSSDLPSDPLAVVLDRNQDFAIITGRIKPVPIKHLSIPKLTPALAARWVLNAINSDLEAVAAWLRQDPLNNKMELQERIEGMVATENYRQAIKDSFGTTTALWDTPHKVASDIADYICSAKA
jgi:hypothetical protein